MSAFSKSMLSLVCGSVILMTGCASKPPLSYNNLESASQLTVNTRKDADRTPYVYSTSVDWNSYNAMIIEPAVIYYGTGHQFGDLPKADQEELAQYMNTEFRKVLGKRFQLKNNAAPGTLRLKLTLMGAETNTAMVSQITRFDLVGLPINAVQGIRGKEGIFMGSVTYSAEIFDANNNRLLKALVTKQHPNAMNIAATFGSLNAAKTGIEKGAEELLTQLK
ncbi:DUF3313 domain-containing protein [Acidovorax sp. SUPP3434]|uniref:DUF3313 domain-containing protein n=1 Tax=Acidovorax sp. SUPP3434 TaxID=2920880 RepID=UPI0023DE3FFE|nr:DUF3313 domain-containing protein [Acidovorax sp. SUPP3434]GKT02118.1 DUF3313 domain-containing protein [Acidovorax sp. SUPP3434]